MAMLMFSVLVKFGLYRCLLALGRLLTLKICHFTGLHENEFSTLINDMHT